MSTDEAMMRRALALAARRRAAPAAAAVLARKDRILATASATGADHAEIAVLQRAAARGATLYTTLEPCAGPCTQAIIASGVRRVVIGAIDPRVNRRSIRALRRAGIEVTAGVLDAECRALNEAWAHALVHRSPFVVLKAATSLDGRIATRTGESQWITCEAARKEGRKLRAAADAILIGVDTAIADDPRLTARIKGRADPRRIVVDSRLRLPPGSLLATTARETPTWVATTPAAPVARRVALEALGVTVLEVKSTRDGRVDIPALMHALHALDVHGVLVEGGAKIQASFLDTGHVHKVVWFMAPMLIGGPRVALEGRGFDTLDGALRLRDVTVTPVGTDWMIVGKS